jgi:zinc protease
VRYLLALALAACVPRSAGPASIVRLPVADDPTVSFRIWFKVGAQDDPPGKEGLAALTALMLTDASTSVNRIEVIKDRLFPMAASYGSQTTAEMTVLFGRTHRDNLAAYYDLFLDAILRPGWRQEDLDRIRARQLNELEHTLRYASDEELGKAVLYGEVFAGLPYGHVVTGTVAGLKAITLDDVRGFYRAHYTRDDVVLGIGGGFDDALVARLGRDLSALPAGAPPPARASRPAPLPATRVTIVEKETASTAISLGFPIDVVRGTREWYALAVAVSWLGEHRSSSGQLYRKIRGERGLNYGDYAYMEHVAEAGSTMKPRPNDGRRQQLFEVWLRPVPHEARHFVLRAALREVQKLVDHGLTRAQLEQTRGFLRNYIRWHAVTTMERLAWALDDRFYDLPEPHLERFGKVLGELTLEEVNAAVRKHLRATALQVAIVTQGAEALRAALVQDAPSPMPYASPKPPAVLDEDREIGGYPLQLRAEDVKVVPVADLFVTGS